MFQRKARALLAMVLATLATSALAQQPQNQQPQPGTTPPAAAATPVPTTPGMPVPGASSMPMMGGMPMMGMMQMMMGQRMAVHVEGRIAFLKAELKITDAHLPLWNAVADAMRANAKSMTGMPDQMAMMQSATPLPERLAADEKMMATHLEGCAN